MSGTGSFPALINPDDGLCSVCSYREKNPFGSQLPPELAQQLSKALNDSIDEMWGCIGQVVLIHPHYSQIGVSR